jgi:hypothetical protein
MKHFITPDLLFSYWIFIWAVIYTFLFTGFSPYVYQSINPLIPLYIALLYNILEFAGLWLAGVSASILLEFIAMIFTLKIVWIFLLRNTKILLWENMGVMAALFVIYNFYLYLNNTNIISLYKDVNTSLRNGDNRTPFMYLINTSILQIRVLLSYNPSRSKSTCTSGSIR